MAYSNTRTHTAFSILFSLSHSAFLNNTPIIKTILSIALPLIV